MLIWVYIEDLNFDLHHTKMALKPEISLGDIKSTFKIVYLNDKQPMRSLVSKPFYQDVGHGSTLLCTPRFT